MSIFSKRLKLLRKNKSIMQKDIANLLSITDRTYRNYESGKIDPPTSKTIKLAEFFDVSLDYLVGRTDNPNSHKN